MRMDRGCRLWLTSFAKKNFWRVSSWYDMDDLLQDGYLLYLRVRERYPDITHPPHIMRLFRTTFTRHLHDLARQRERQLDTPLSVVVANPDVPHEVVLDLMLRGERGLEEVQVALVKAPECVLRLLELLASEDGCRRLRSRYRLVHGVRETLNQRIARLTRQGEGTNTTAALREYMRGM